MYPHALVIDDNLNNLEILGGLLAEQGIQCSFVSDPTKVNDELEKLPTIGVVFCDLEMPKMDGIEVLHKLRERLGKAIPIIAYSVHLSEINLARKMGFDGFLGKPLNADRFPELIRRILNGQPVWELP